MSDETEKWKSPTGHPISSSETDGLKQCPFCGSHNIEINRADIMTGIVPRLIEWWGLTCMSCRNGATYPSKDGLIKKWNARANEPDTVSVDELKIYNETVTKQATLRKQAWNSCIDHLRAKYPNGVKWRQ